MIKKIGPVSLSIFLLLSVILINGCETTKRITKGIGCTIGDTTKGAVKDINNFWQVILKTDSWIKENLW